MSNMDWAGDYRALLLLAEVLATDEVRVVRQSLSSAVYPQKAPIDSSKPVVI